MQLPVIAPALEQRTAKAARPARAAAHSQPPAWLGRRYPGRWRCQPWRLTCRASVPSQPPVAHLGQRCPANQHCPAWSSQTAGHGLQRPLPAQQAVLLNVQQCPWLVPAGHQNHQADPTGMALGCGLGRCACAAAAVRPLWHPCLQRCALRMTPPCGGCCGRAAMRALLQAGGLARLAPLQLLPLRRHGVLPASACRGPAAPRRCGLSQAPQAGADPSLGRQGQQQQSPRPGA